MNEIPQNSEKRLKASEVSKRLKVPTVTVRAWLKKGLFPNAELVETILGKVWLVPESDVENFRFPSMGRPRQSTDAVQDSDED